MFRQLARARLPRSDIRWLLGSAIALAVVAAPLAGATGEGRSIRGGERNPSSNESVELERETKIMANTGTYGTRQSNKRIGDGGGAIYGCRSLPGREPCLRANNLNTGRAFEFETDGNEGGRILLADTSGAPLTTNATGVATGFNADKVDGKHANEFLATTGKAADAEKLDGKDSDAFAGAGDLRFAVVNTTGALVADRGAATATLADPATSTYRVVFDEAVDKCSWTASPTGSSSGAALGVSSGPDAKTVDVDAADGSPTGFHLQVIC